VVRDHADAVEADMRWRYHVSSADLSWRERAALIRHLPDDSALAAVLRGGEPRWSITDHLLDDVRMWLMGLAGVDARKIKPHPQRPLPKKWVDPAREKKFADARRRARERRRAIEAGEIT
jgi:hypothetical protein